MISSDFEIRKLAKHLRATLLKELPHDCGREIDPGIDEVSEWQIFAHRPTTPDQLLIERYLHGVLKANSSILHIGVGNSSLAVTCSPRVKAIFGTTIHPKEKQYADQLLLPNYEVGRINKYSTDMRLIKNGFDFIIDNNPNSYCCCYFHFVRMMLSYIQKLTPNGVILTAQGGLKWVVPHNAPEWSFDYDDWFHIGKLFDLRTYKAADGVFAMGHEATEPIRRQYRRPYFAVSFWRFVKPKTPRE